MRNLAVAGPLACVLCAPAVVVTAQTPAAPDLSELWQAPTDLASLDLFNGPWRAALAPDPDATYLFIEPKKGGINPRG